MLQNHQRPIPARLDNNSHAANHRNSNHNILSTINNTSNGQSFNNSYNNHRPGNAISVGGGPCSGGIDCVDNSNTLLAAGTPLLPPELHTPSETSETSSSSEPSSSGEEWESGECDQVIISDNISSSSNNKKSSSRCSSDKIICDVVTVDRKYDLHYCKDQQRKLYYSADDNYYCGSSVAVAQTQSQQQPLPEVSTTSTEGNLDSNNCSTNNINASSMTRILSQRKKFKAKTGNVKVVNHTNPIIGKKIKWLANMKSDPDFRETLNKNVHFRSTGMSPGRNSNDSLDYYSSICDKQLSFGSPCKSPGELIRLGNLSVTKEECSDIVVATKKSPIIPVFDVPPNTPTTPKEIPLLQEATLDRKSPAKSESNFKTRFFNFGRRDSNTHDKPMIVVEEPPILHTNLLPVIHVQHSNSAPQIPSNRDNNRDNSNNSNSSSNSSNSHRCSPFSFRELRQEIQSAIKNHQHPPNHKHDETSSKTNK